MLRACEAGGSIKPGAQAPGSLKERFIRARETGDSAKGTWLSPAFAGWGNWEMLFTWGLRPRLYASACFAG